MSREKVGKGKLVQPAKATSPAGVYEKLPVLATQELFRSALAARPGMPSPASRLVSVDLAASSFGHSHLSHSIVSPTALVPAGATALAITPGGGSGSSPATQAARSHTHERVAKEIAKYVEDELSMMAAQNDGTATRPTLQRVAVFKSAVRMVLPHLPHPLAPLIERAVWEYDRFLTDLETNIEDSTRLRERQRLEAHFQRHFIDEAQVKETLLEKRRHEFDTTESDMTSRITRLENQLQSLRDENKMLRLQQNDDTERWSAMAQAVVESRLSAQRAELHMTEMREQWEKVKQGERHHVDMLQDAVDMIKLLRQHNIEYDLRSKFILTMGMV